MLEVGDAWPLTARSRQLRAIVANSHTGRAGGYVVSGERGVGRTRLAREVHAAAAANGRVSEWLTATRSAAAVPFGAVFPLLPRAGQVHRLAVLRDLADRFATLGDDRGLPIVVIDDAHLLDDASATLAHHLVHHSLAFLVATVRTGARCPDAVTALWKDGPLQRIELDRLPTGAMDTLLGHTFADSLDTVSRYRLRHLSAGSPLLLRELLTSARDSGTLRRYAGMWNWTGFVAPTARLTEIVTSWSGPLDDAVARVLETVACGEPMPLHTLQLLADPEAVTSAERSRLVVVEQSGARHRARLSSPLAAEILRSTMPRTAYSAITLRIAEVVAQTPIRRRDDVLHFGSWQLRAAPGGDPELVLAAARQARERLDFGLAERLATAALHRGGGRRAAHLLARVLNNLGRYEESQRVLAAQPASPNGAADLDGVVARAEVRYWVYGDAAGADTELAAMSGHGDVDGRRCLILLLDSRCTEALRLGEQVLDRADTDERGIVPYGAVLAAAAAAAAAGVLGRQDIAEAIHRRGLAIAAAHKHDLPLAATLVDAGLCLGLIACGQLERAWSMIEQHAGTDLVSTRAVDGSTLSDGARMVVGALAGLRGVIAKARGHLEVAATSIRESLLLLAESAPFRLAAISVAELAGGLAMKGDHRRAERLLTGLDQPGQWTSRLFAPWLTLDRAWTLAASGDASAAAASARRAASQAQGLDQPTIEAWALYDAARLGQAGTVRNRLVALSIELGTPVLSAFAGAATALASGNADQMMIAGSIFGEAGMHLHATEAMATAAMFYRRTGQQPASNAAALRAQRYSQSCSSARTPMLDTADVRINLSKRENEVAALASSGLTSRQIADRLRISIRTVDNYLGRVYMKLGVSGRADLIDSPGEPGRADP